ncbi:hypothetical protein D3C84_723590 [compost metagenome]
MVALCGASGFVAGVLRRLALVLPRALRLLPVQRQAPGFGSLDCPPGSTGQETLVKQLVEPEIHLRGVDGNFRGPAAEHVLNFGLELQRFA